MAPRLWTADRGVQQLGPGGIWAAAIGHALWTWVERLIISDALGARIILTDPPVYLAGPGPDSYTSELYSLVLITAIVLASWHRLRPLR
jgi:hypothetical protein